MSRIPQAIAIAILAFAPSAARAQFQPAATKSAIYPTDTPWRDFPLGRLRAGAHVRLTWADGQRTEARVFAVGDSALQLAPAGGDAPRSFTLAELRALPSVEVQAHRVGSVQSRINTIAFVIGTAAGAFIGVARHRHDDPTVSQVPSKGVDIARAALLGGVVGVAIGWNYSSGPRWRAVTIQR